MKRAASKVYGELKERAQEIGLNIRVEKTKVMIRNRRTRRISEIFMWDIPVCGEYKLVQIIVNHTQ